ncbi:MAG: transcriptional regulator, partial [Verrucomicrobiota bacterium]
SLIPSSCFRSGKCDGNLITHLRKLTEAGYVTMEKVPQLVGRAITRCSLTEAGRVAFTKYLSVMEQIVKTIDRGEETDSSNEAPDDR